MKMIDLSIARRSMTGVCFESPAGMEIKKKAETEAVSRILWITRKTG